MQGDIVVLAGGTGGAKLARGMTAVREPERVAVIANTGDDIEIYGAHVSPDPDLVCFWLADQIDERGWGLRGDTFAVMEALRALGSDVWFNLGDRDPLAMTSAPVLAVSPIVGGGVLKGPTATFMSFASLDCSADGVADFYGQLLDGMVSDENVARLPTLQLDTRMDDAASRARVAERVLGFAEALAKG